MMLSRDGSNALASNTPMEDTMSKIIVTEFVSLDGVAQDPHKWSLSYRNDKIQKFKYDEMAATGAMLLGRKTYEIFAGAWPSQTGDFADRFNSLPRLVASRTLKTLAWSPSQLLAEPIANSVAKAKETVKGAIYIHGSLALSQELSKLGLVDEYHLLTYPVVLGEGQRLFGEKQKAELELISLEDFGSGVVAQKYRVKR
jgi:dihydrofolate reductase